MSSSILIVMGVSGCGKTTIGRRIAVKLGWIFAEGDDFHSPANLAKMHAGDPLTDADRAPWLGAIENWLDECGRAGQSGVITCSALKRTYREQLRNNRPQVLFLYLRASEALLAKRLQQRHGHFMPPALLHSQLVTLEEPNGETAVCIIDIDHCSPDQIVARALVCVDPADGARVNEIAPSHIR